LKVAGFFFACFAFLIPLSNVTLTLRVGRLEPLKVIQKFFHFDRDYVEGETYFTFSTLFWLPFHTRLACSN
jgi:hypothetical protein